jgi:hypothetical protein
MGAKNERVLFPFMSPKLHLEFASIRIHMHFSETKKPANTDRQALCSVAFLLGGGDRNRTGVQT